jgi:hypothetical protein
MSLKEAVARRRAEEAAAACVLNTSSSLKEAIERRHAELVGSRNPLYSASLKDPVMGLIVEISGSDIWFLPWSHFISGYHDEAGKYERLVLTFSANEVSIIGINLDLLMPDIAHQRLEKVRAAPGKYLKSSGKEPFIEKIQVFSLDE